MCLACYKESDGKRFIKRIEVAPRVTIECRVTDTEFNIILLKGYLFPRATDDTL
jgi:hypothetical protein